MPYTQATNQLSAATIPGQSGAMVMKRYSAFPIAPALVPLYQIVWCHIQDTHSGKVVPLCRDVVGVGVAIPLFIQELKKLFFNLMKILY